MPNKNYLGRYHRCLLFVHWSSLTKKFCLNLFPQHLLYGICTFSSPIRVVAATL